MSGPSGPLVDHRRQAIVRMPHYRESLVLKLQLCPSGVDHYSLIIRLDSPGFILCSLIMLSAYWNSTHDELRLDRNHWKLVARNEFRPSESNAAADSGPKEGLKFPGKMSVQRVIR